jgi:hypothetical protein
VTFDKAEWQRKRREEKAAHRPVKMCAHCNASPVRSTHGRALFCDACVAEKKYQGNKAIRQAKLNARPERLCERCGAAPPRTRHARTKFCAPCKQADAKDRALSSHYSRHEEVLAKKAAYREANREQLRQAFRDRFKRPEVKAKSRADKRKRLYGVDLERFGRMLAEQDSCCQICRTELNDSTAHVDHDHATGNVRALLCRTCNLDVGKLETLESKELLFKMVDYILEHREAGRRGVAA